MTSRTSSLVGHRHIPRCSELPLPSSSTISHTKDQDSTARMVTCSTMAAMMWTTMIPTLEEVRGAVVDTVAVVAGADDQVKVMVQALGDEM